MKLNFLQFSHIYFFTLYPMTMYQKYLQIINYNKIWRSDLKSIMDITTTIHCVTVNSHVATNDIWVAPTRDLASSDGNVPEDFWRRNARLISNFVIIFVLNFNIILLWDTHKCILKLLNILKYLQIITKLSYIEKNNGHSFIWADTRLDLARGG